MWWLMTAENHGASNSGCSSKPIGQDIICETMTPIRFLPCKLFLNHIIFQKVTNHYGPVSTVIDIDTGAVFFYNFY